MQPNKYRFGEIIDHTPEGDVVFQMALVLQRRETVDITGKKAIHQIVGCPHCGGHHEHADGPGINGPNCGGSRGDYAVMPSPLQPVPRGSPYPKLKKKKRRAA